MQWYMTSDGPEIPRPPKTASPKNTPDKQDAPGTAQSAGSQSAAAQSELEEQYQMLSQSLDYLGLVVIAVLISYFTLDSQKQQLGALVRGEIETMPEVSYFPMQFTSAAMVLCATSFYSNLSQDILRQPQTDPQAAQLNQINAFANELVLLAAAVRIYALLEAEFSPGTPAEKEQEEADNDAQAPFAL